MKTEIFYARKLYQGRVSVQSSVVSYCQRLGRKLIVDYEGQRMLVHNLEAYECDGQSFLARHTDKYIKAGKTYKLYDYIWAPIEEKHQEQGQVFTFDNETHIKRMLAIKKTLGL